ncbi:MAG: radical SAM protein [Chitinophagaceae bacterium]
MQVHPTLQCNLTCRHCYSSSGPGLRHALSPDDIIPFLQYAQAYGFNVTSISGGEPFIYGGLQELLAGSRALGYKNMCASNATLFKSSKAERCLQLIDLLAISVDGDEALHNEIRNNETSFAKMQEGIRIAKEQNVLFGMIHTITERSWDKLLWLADFAFENGAQLLQLHPMELTGRAAIEFRHLLPSEETLHRVFIISAYLRQKYEGLMHIHMDFYHRNLVLQNPAAVSYYGDEFEITKANLAQVLRSIIVDPMGNIYPLSYGFGEQYCMGNLQDVKEGKDVFENFINQKGASLYRLFAGTYQHILQDTETDMVKWTELIVQQSHQKREESIAV